MDKITLLSAEISKAYKMSHKDVPKIDEIRMEAAIMLKDCSSIPEGYFQRCYNHARIYGRSSIPTSKDVMQAWNGDIKDEYKRELTTKAIEYRPKHECQFCGVVAIRLGVMVPDATEWEIGMSKAMVTTAEINCVKATSENSVIRFWNEKYGSPYYGKL